MKKLFLITVSFFLVLAVAAASGFAAPITNSSATAGKMGSTVTNGHPTFAAAFDSDFTSYFAQAFARSTSFNLGTNAEIDFHSYSGDALIATALATSTNTFEVRAAGLARIDFSWFGDMEADGATNARYSLNLAHSLGSAFDYEFYEAGVGASTSYFIDSVGFDEFLAVDGRERLEIVFDEADIGTTFNLTMTLETTAFSLFPLSDSDGYAYADFFNSVNATYSPHLQTVPQVVPVPPSAILFFSGIAGMLGVRRWRLRK